MTIRLQMYDGGTYAVKVDSGAPGMERVRWVPADYEEEAAWIDNTDSTNLVMRDTSPLVVEPWPLPLNNHLVFDNHEHNIDMAFSLDDYSPLLEEASPLPGGTSTFKEVANENPIARADTIKSDRLSPSEVRQVVDNPGEWLRYPADNEYGSAATHEQAMYAWQGLGTGPAFRLRLDDNDHFVPFDLAKHNRYKLSINGYPENDPGGYVSTHHHLNFKAGGDYRVHLRPRLWWVVARCQATFIWVDMLTLSYDLVDFIVGFHMRPPVYPYRHDINNTRQSFPIEDYLGVPVSYDIGIDWEFASSRMAAQLSREILKMEWRGWSSAYVLYTVTPATLYITREIPRVGEVTCVVEHMDGMAPAGGIDVVQQVDLSAEYPRVAIGTFFSEFFTRYPDG